jgi:hypothetical protein
MSWLFSQALVEEYSPANYSDGASSAQLSVMPTPHKFWRSDKMIESSDHSRFGLTSRVLTDGHGTELLMSYLEDSLAKISAGPEKVPESTGREADFGQKCGASFAKYNRGTSTWKTAQCSLFEDSGEFLETWPRWGSMRNGASFLRQIPALPICASASGLWQTPVADDSVNRQAGKWNSRGEPKLSAQVKLCPTPTAMNFTGGAAMCKWGGAGARAKLKTMFTPEEINGQLNPEWVEWLMGWPIGWTDLKPLAMDKFQEWLQQHGKS